MENHSSISAYIRNAEPQIRHLLEQINTIIHEEAPKAEEAIKYGMPTYVLEGNLVHFAACKNHIGFYPAPSALTEYAEELSRFKTSKGAVQFPLDEPLPEGLIRKIVRFRVKENKQQAALKKKS